MAETKNAKRVSTLPHPCGDTLAQLLGVHELLHPRSSALIIDNQSYTYAELAVKVRQLAVILEKNQIKRLGILASKSLEAYVGVLAAHWIGAAYIPLNIHYPELRLQNIMTTAGIDGLIADPTNEVLANDLLASFPASCQKIMLADIAGVNTVDLSMKPAAVVQSELAYLMFTSGSSGAPKGVPITFANLASFIRAVVARYPLTTADRVSQFSSLSFDVSLFDMCLAFANGAALYVMADDIRLAPARFIQDNQLTVWLSVPSIISNMHKLKMLKPGTFPSLKYSLFTAEVLTVVQAQQWAIAAPASQLENLYGPTEATIDCLGQVFDECIIEKAFRGQVAIGAPFADISAALIDENEKFLMPDAKGELVIAGAQVANGYWQDASLSAKKFKELTHPVLGLRRWYLTGDYCYQDSNEIFHYIARLDNQCKLLGNRIELEEIEFNVKDITKSQAVVASVVNDEIVVVTDVKKVDMDSLVHQLKLRLPLYMLPGKVLYRDGLLINSNGKIDRKAMTEWMQQALANSRGGAAC
jgi:D-alanine--poly(phosphoribitol) ligase subunit 1